MAGPKNDRKHLDLTHLETLPAELVCTQCQESKPTREHFTPLNGHRQPTLKCLKCRTGGTSKAEVNALSQPDPESESEAGSEADSSLDKKSKSRPYSHGALPLAQEPGAPYEQASHDASEQGVGTHAQLDMHDAAAEQNSTTRMDDDTRDGRSMAQPTIWSGQIPDVDPPSAQPGEHAQHPMRELQDFPSRPGRAPASVTVEHDGPQREPVPPSTRPSILSPMPPQPPYLNQWAQPRAHRPSTDSAAAVGSSGSFQASTTPGAWPSGPDRGSDDGDLNQNHQKISSGLPAAGVDENGGGRVGQDTLQPTPKESVDGMGLGLQAFKTMFSSALPLRRHSASSEHLQLDDGFSPAGLTTSSPLQEHWLPRKSRLSPANTANTATAAAASAAAATTASPSLPLGISLAKFRFTTPTPLDVMERTTVDQARGPRQQHEREGAGKAGQHSGGGSIPGQQGGRSSVGHSPRAWEDRGDDDDGVRRHTGTVQTASRRVGKGSRRDSVQPQDRFFG